MNPEEHPTTPDPGQLPDETELEPEPEPFDPEATQPGQNTAVMEPVPAQADEPPDEPPPAPRIVAETPIGGKAPPMPRRILAEPEPEAESAAPEVAAPQVTGADQPAPGLAVRTEPPVEAINPDAPTLPGSLSAAEVRAMLRAAEADSEAASEEVSEEASEEVSEEVESATAAEPIQDTGPEPPAPAQTIRSTGPFRPTTPRPPEPAAERDAPEAASDVAGEWDDDLSPELSAVLFGQKRESAAPVEAASQTGTPASPAAAGEAASPARAAVSAGAQAPVESAVTAGAAPVHITSIAQAGSLPLAAEQHTAPAPDTPLKGKVRYVRIEEPLKNDQGQRIKETWQYFQPDRPSLAGRLVQDVKREAITYADGSQRWTYERRYTDRGRDTRAIRVSADGDYVEREDEVSKLDADSGKRVMYKENEQMILAAPPEEKRGFLSSLLGRDDEPDPSQIGWRQATATENRHARKQGGAALRRGFLWF